MKGLIWIAAAGVATFVAALLGPAALAGDDDGRVMSRARLVGVNFVESCRLSHTASDDPIVVPGRPGASHDHTFVGNRTTNASSIYHSLRAGGTTCMRAEDTAAYWVPTLYQHGQPCSRGGRRSTTGAPRSTRCARSPTT